MTSAGGVSFRELMIGGFAMGETDPIAGEREGVRSRSFLAMQAFAAIPNLGGFLADPEHTGELAGSVRFPPLSGWAQAERGVFKLFVRAQEPRAKAMVYTMCFRAQGREFCLHGQKHVMSRSVLHSWKDTTTLYCSLHQGSDEHAPVFGAGILHLTPLQFARQLASFRTVNVHSLSEKAKALASFGSFFARELIDSYLS